MSGWLDNSPAEIAQQLLIDMKFGTDPSVANSLWPVYCDSVPEFPDSLICVQDTIGRGKYGAAYDRLQINGERQEFHGLIVVVRAPTKKEAYAKARPLALAMDQNVLSNTVTVDGKTYYVFSTGRFGDLLDLGKEVGSNRSVLAVNAMISVRQYLDEKYAHG